MATKKNFSDLDQQQIFKRLYNDESGTLGVDGFVVGVVGRKIERTVVTTTVTNDTEVFTFSENGSAVYTIKVIYSDASLETLLSVERTA